MTGLPDPEHPLLSIVQVAEMNFEDSAFDGPFGVDFYCVSLKRNVTARTRYGRQPYDYDKGIMTFLAPGQLQELEGDMAARSAGAAGTGMALFIHPDFLYQHPLAHSVKQMGFFSYAVHEALHLSPREEKLVTGVLESIADESKHIDKHSQEIILAQTEVILRYAIRFYERQFVTRKKAGHHLADKMDQLLDQWISNQQGLPSVEWLAGQLQVSTHYLGDLLRVTTGHGTQYHIQEKMMEKAKQYLGNTTMTVSEIAYLLGFGYSQSFNKFFKKKMNISPLDYRLSLRPN